MEIKIRNVDPVLVGMIDDLAKEKGLSRNEFLREQLEVIAYKNLLSDHRKKVDESIKVATEVLEDVLEKMFELEHKIDKLMHFLAYATEVDLHKMDRFIEENINGLAREWREKYYN